MKIPIFNSIYQKKIKKINTKKIDINRNTNVLSYFIIRCELYNRLNEFIKFCRLHNQNYVKMTQENKWFQFIKKNKKIIKNNRRFNRLQKNNPVYKTMKMSILENFQHRSVIFQLQMLRFQYLELCLKIQLSCMSEIL